MAEGIVRFQNVALGYDGVPVLEGLAFDVNRGDFLALVGPNGCGKSTILKGMAGILEPLRGCISREIDGSPVRFGYVPQRETIEMVFPLTVFQVALMGTYGRVGPGRPVTHAKRELVRGCLDDVGLGDLQRKPFPALSGGQRQRVLIAQTVAEGLTLNFPQHRATFEANLKAFMAQLDAKIQEWKVMARPLRGVKFGSYHQDFTYFADRFGMEYGGT
ncbi:MAG: ATP-binding cassette domain-containing protein, partial [Nitrospirae bacterium]